MPNLIPAERIESKIYLIRGQKVMLDFDLAVLYHVKTKNLKRLVKRNITRFSSDFMFQLNKEEYALLRCQFGTLKRGQHSKYLPYAFTEHGALALSSALNSKRAIEVGIFIVRAFVKLRQLLLSHKELAQKLNELEKKTQKHDIEIYSIFKAIRELMAVPDVPKKQIGFVRE
jgi:phage regulator Rha-like protein